jgi:hypothetical protein
MFFTKDYHTKTDALKCNSKGLPILFSTEYKSANSYFFTHFFQIKTVEYSCDDSGWPLN